MTGTVCLHSTFYCSRGVLTDEKVKCEVKEISKFIRFPLASIARSHFEERSAPARCAPE